jgi:hypothetical protein
VLNRSIALAPVLLFALVPHGAWAQSTAESALAETLYRQGRQLMADGKIAEACPKFAESHRLDPATGTLLNLAACHEAEQKYATASLEYGEAVARAQRDHRDDRVRFAQARLTALEPKVSTIRVELATSADSDGVETELDGAPVRGPARNVPLPIDPGDHVVVARAAGHKAWSQHVIVDKDAMNVTVTVPPLEPEMGAPAVDTGAPSNAKPNAMPSSIYAAGGATLVLSAGALATGIVYVARYAQYGHVETTAQASTTRGWGVANAVLTGGALVSAGITLYLYWNRPAPAQLETGNARTMVMPWFTASGGGLCFQGSL